MDLRRSRTALRGRLLAVTVVVGLMAAACGSSAGSPAAGSPAAPSVAPSAAASTAASPAASAEASAAAGGNLVVGITSDPDTLFPWKATQFQAVAILGTIYGTLTELDATLNVVPGLAESWQVSTDGLTVTLKLRTGVKFQNGKDFTSADVKFSIDKIRDEATAAVAASTFASVQEVQAPDPLTAVLKLKSPDAAILAGLASVNLAMLSKDDTEAALGTAPNGTGPFAFKERKPNESITLAANPGYWGDKPKLASVEFRIIPDETSIVAAMQSGNVQFAVLDDPLVAKSADGNGITVTKTPQLAYHALQLNARHAPLDNVKVRLAISCAIDRQQVLDTAALSEGQVTGPITSPAFRSDPSARPCPTRDVTKAKALLAEAGFPKGVTIKTIVSQGEYATSVNEAQNLQAQLKDAGITLQLDVMEIGGYVNKWLAADFDAAVALNGGRPDPDTMYGRYFTSTGNLNKVAGFSSPALDQLFAQGKQTTDVSKRKDIYAQISKNLEDNAVWVWMFSSYAYTATTAGVSGFIPMPNASLQYLRVTSLN
jgi:peptide/nickel transport system substrate-binding protein